MTQTTELGADFDLYDVRALVDRLSRGLANGDKSVVFVVGSALTAPVKSGDAGVPGVNGVIDLITNEFDDERRADLTRELAGSDNPYQTAFRFLLDHRGQQAANSIIRRAVGAARRLGSTKYLIDGNTDDEGCRGFDLDSSGWALSPGVAALGELAARYPNLFGRTILTTNFDPLIGAAIRCAGGVTFRTVLHRDGNLSQSAGDGTHVVHLHGYWYGSDTLHTPRQLNQVRPQLNASLAQLLRDRTVVVLAYGGWDDAFTKALVNVVLDDSAYPEVIWCFRETQPRVRQKLLETLLPGIDRGRVSLYGGVDCNAFLPELVSTWERLSPPKRPVLPASLTPPQFTDSKTEVVQRPIVNARILLTEGDQPPVITYYVGRERETQTLLNTTASVIYITGIGGQGKSALAAHLFNHAHTTRDFDHKIWKDCKEQSDKFEDTLAVLIEALNDGRVSPSEISRQPIDVLADLFTELTKDLSIMVVFDNVDHYVDLEMGGLIGAAGAFIARFQSSESKAKLVFTCRPTINIEGENALSLRLEGLNKEDAHVLFSLRSAVAEEDAIVRAHVATNGHAFWLDLLAAQVAQRDPPVKLDSLLASISSDHGEIPDATLRSIWAGLKDREQIVLQALAETLRPTSELQLSDYLGSRCRYNQMTRAIRVLFDLNLLVTKEGERSQTLYELHPVIRAFIRKTFKRTERVGFIDSILAYYSAFFGIHRAHLNTRPDPGVIAHWLEGAELCLNAEHYDRAFVYLDEVRNAVRRSEPPGEFVRVVSSLFSTLKPTELRSYPQFDQLCSDYIKVLVNLGRTELAATALELYRETLEGKDARYINYCDLQAYLHWMNENYENAIKWGEEGETLKQNSGVDTSFSSAHTLALARRDAGDIDSALKFFLEGANIEDVLRPEPPEEDRGEAFYGNIGRCLQFMNQVEPALICYAKSAQIIEHRGENSLQENQAFVRQWIGELLVKKGERAAGLSFLVAALHKWARFSPPRSDAVGKFIEEQLALGDDKLPSPDKAEDFALRWIDHVV